MGSIDFHLSQSIACYRSLTAVFEKARKALAAGAPAAKLRSLAEEIKTLDQQARSDNTRFQELASETGVRLEDHPLFPEWRSLVAQVREENRQTARRLHAAMVVAKDELSRLGSGRQMLSGYKSGRPSTGRQIDIRSA
jgi:hypothetical protein